MEIKVEDESKKSQQQPLLSHNNGTAELSDDHSSPITDKEDVEDVQTFVQIAISKTFKSTAHLANLLPTGTVLAFQLLAPLTTNAGVCDAVSRVMTAGLVALCVISCFILSFTDSFRDSAGRVRYGLATFRGMWVIDGVSPGLPAEEAAQYRIRFIDWVHGLMSVVVFAGVAMFDENVVGCFYPEPSLEMKEVLTVVPVAIGVFGSMVFVAFPTTRHGIGFPLSAN